MARTKKTKSTARFGAGYGLRVREKTKKIEKDQRKRQKCPFCNKEGVKRLSNGVWKCPKCEKKFASGSYLVDLQKKTSQ